MPETAGNLNEDIAKDHSGRLSLRSIVYFSIILPFTPLMLCSLIISLSSLSGTVNCVISCVLISWSHFSNSTATHLHCQPVIFLQSFKICFLSTSSSFMLLLRPSSLSKVLERTHKYENLQVSSAKCTQSMKSKFFVQKMLHDSVLH